MARTRSTHPGRSIAGTFAAGILIGTLLLLHPAARAGEGRADLITALFTATSSICVTGLAVEDTGTYWSPLGEAIILLLVQVGGLGILTIATVTILALSKKIGLRRKLQAQREAALLDSQETRSILVRIVTFSLLVETLVALTLTLRLWSTGMPLGEASWSGTFHAITSYNQAGLSLYEDSLTAYQTDPLITLPICAAIIIGGLGFPVIFEVLRHLRRERRNWSLHTKITLSTTTGLYLLGVLALLGLEWRNENTLGTLDTGGKLLTATFAGITPRSAGLNTIEYTQMEPASLLVTDILMFIGGSPGSTAGGIRVTTFALLGYVIWAELRGERDVTAHRRTIPTDAIRAALTIALVSVGIVTLSTLLLLSLTGAPLSAALFETISAFSTTGLSLGITAEADTPTRILLILLMYLGRIGVLTLGTALALREREKLYQHPEERPIIA